MWRSFVKSQLLKSFPLSNKGSETFSFKTKLKTINSSVSKMSPTLMKRNSIIECPTSVKISMLLSMSMTNRNRLSAKFKIVCNCSMKRSNNINAGPRIWPISCKKESTAMFSRGKEPLLQWLWLRKCATSTPLPWKSATKQKTKEKQTEIGSMKKASTCQKT